MNFYGIAFTLLTSIWLLRAPRNWAPLPLLLGVVYVTPYQQLEIGLLHFPAMRVLIVVGALRAIAKGERMSGGINSFDRAVMFWAIWYVCSIAFHQSYVLIGRLGSIFDAVGVYYLFRVFIRGVEDVRTAFKILCLVLLPLAATMLVERFRGYNPLSLLGFAGEMVLSTKGHYRAQGSFGHPILAGTAGAVSLPMAFCFWRENRRLALTGMAVSLAIVFASGSSGPIMTALAALGALALWMIRSQMAAIRWLAISVIVVLNFVMNDPVYFLMARIDITGGSTGYFRAQLIRSGLEHLSEWWFAGTDFTRHWMPTGITADPHHTDMTNYYLQMGVWGGLPLMFLFMWVLVAAFTRIGKALRAGKGLPLSSQFVMWTLGAILFAHATAFWSISYFDQTIIFLWFVLGCIGSLQIAKRTALPALGENSPRRVTEQIPSRSPLTVERLQPSF
jgi:hypothetical protein